MVTCICSCLKHSSYGSKYNKGEVPEKYFYKDPENPTGQKFKQCKWCRETYAKSRNESRRKFAAKAKESQKDENKYMICTGRSHISISKHDKHKVPRKKFIKRYVNGRISYFKHCLDCRVHENERRHEGHNKLTKKERKKKFHCSSCNKTQDISQRFINEDGKFSKQCIKCRESKRLCRKKIRKQSKINTYKIKKEIMAKLGSCCERCQRIFIKGSSKSGLPLIILETYVNDKKRMVKYMDEIYRAKNLLLIFLANWS